MITETVAAKLLGAFFGTIISLVFLPPTTRAGAVRRTVVSMICGPIFSPVTHDYVKWPNTLEYWLASAAFTAGISWWMIGFGTILFRAWAKRKAGITDD